MTSKKKFEKINNSEKVNEISDPTMEASKVIKSKKISLKKKLKPYMDYLGILNYKAFLLDYYESENDLYIIESDYLETFILKIFSNNSPTTSAETEKFFINTVKNISKLTPDINVAHKEEAKLKQFLFTDRMAGANKKWGSLNANQKSDVIREIAKLLYKIHTYDSVSTFKKEIFGKYTSPKKSWTEFLNDICEKNILFMTQNDFEKSKITKYRNFVEESLIKISTMKIKPSLLHGSISINNEGYIRSILFLGSKISAILNYEESIYGDKIFDLVNIFEQLIGKNPDLEKDFNNVYGKLKPEELERLNIYKKILFYQN